MHTRFKFFVGTGFFLLCTLLFIFGRNLQNFIPLNNPHFIETTRIFVLYLNIPIILVWLTLGTISGLITVLIICAFLIFNFPKEAYLFSFISFFTTSFAAYSLCKFFKTQQKALEVEREKTEEELNLLRAEIESEENNNARIRNTLARTAQLKKIIEDYSQMLSEDDILDSIAQNSLELFKAANRVLLYLVDTEKQELKLVRSRRRNSPFPVKAKKGDIFDRWVLKHRVPLLIKDKNKDFRFSLREDIDRGFDSIISAPLTSEHKIMGILRIDAAGINKFDQSDLRFLDIIADLSSVSLENAILYEKVETLAIHDSLTGLYVHEYFIERLENEVKSSLRNNIAISLVMLDLDNFKAYNDKYGHSAGDLILKHVSSILCSFARPGDVISRYGGEEFALLLLNRDKAEAAKIAEDIRKAIGNTPFVLRRIKTQMTVSIGVASCPSEEKMAKEIIRLADSRLYRAKEEGKNRVCCK